MNWIILFIVFAIVAVVLIWRGTKGPAHTLKSIYKPIDELLERGFDEGFLIITISYSKMFLQLRKYILNKKNYGIELVFPKAPWSVDYFDKIEKLCINSKIPYSIRKEVGKYTLDFLYVNYGKDSKKAYENIKQILTAVFSVNDNTKLFLRMENASLK